MPLILFKKNYAVAAFRNLHCSPKTYFKKSCMTRVDDRPVILSSKIKHLAHMVSQPHSPHPLTPNSQRCQPYQWDSRVESLVLTLDLWWVHIYLHLYKYTQTHGCHLTRCHRWCLWTAGGFSRESGGTLCQHVTKVMTSEKSEKPCCDSVATVQSLALIYF